MRRLVATALALTLATTVPAQSADFTVEDLTWMAGYWTGSDGAVEELWLAPAAGMMVGIHRDIRNNERAFFEYLRIETRSDGVYYVSRPSNQDEAEFQMAHMSETTVRFDNFAHDYPHTISYFLSGDSLIVAISGGIGEEYRSSRWVMKRSSMKETE
jgi:hypothetical protein